MKKEKEKSLTQCRFKGSLLGYIECPIWGKWQNVMIHTN